MTKRSISSDSRCICLLLSPPPTFSSSASPSSSSSESSSAYSLLTFKVGFGGAAVDVSVLAVAVSLQNTFWNNIPFKL